MPRQITVPGICKESEIFCLFSKTKHKKKQPHTLTHTQTHMHRKYGSSSDKDVINFRMKWAPQQAWRGSTLLLVLPLAVVKQRRQPNGGKRFAELFTNQKKKQNKIHFESLCYFFPFFIAFLISCWFLWVFGSRTAPRREASVISKAPRRHRRRSLLQDANSSGKSSATANYTLKWSCLARLMMGFALGFHGLSIK